ncbi:hypothetical protein MAPG_04744 [Magnaporthiopsis poae ATCC 64411]|uniref:Uncharacterized protein n=1 Tax=Magnaporthiopsis poae (strain ATCC 64411 / 73-15) TaxID=644358 RepID=A0A0C4DXJ0_MAGP6|nr:hypothetical protein MAPG_04744 [Magnaporthiopsis poae ATCC 64411]
MLARTGTALARSTVWVTAADLSAVNYLTTPVECCAVHGNIHGVAAVDQVAAPLFVPPTILRKKHILLGLDYQIASREAILLPQKLPAFLRETLGPIAPAAIVRLSMEASRFVVYPGDDNPDAPFAVWKYIEDWPLARLKLRVPQRLESL